MVPSQPEQPLLRVKDLHVSFFTDRGELRVVEDVSFNIFAGETMALVGESGCGKTVTALAIMGLIDAPGRIVRGNIRLKEQELVGLPEKALQEFRGRRIGMIFQEPMTSLNPVFTVGDQISEVLIRHFAMDKDEARTEVLRLLKKVGIPSPDRRIDQYPHELSGGMKQRAALGRLMATEAPYWLLDEPFSSLDDRTVHQLQRLLLRLVRENRISALFVTHSIDEAVFLARRVVVLSAQPGRVVETLDIDMPYPRDRLSAAYGETMERIRRQIESALEAEP